MTFRWDTNRTPGPALKSRRRGSLIRQDALYRTQRSQVLQSTSSAQRARWVWVRCRYFSWYIYGKPRYKSAQLSIQNYIICLYYL